MTESTAVSGKRTVWTKDFIILFLGQLAAMCGQNLVNSLLTLYCKELGASDIVIGTVVSLFYTVALCVRPFSGPAIDAWNRKRLYIVMMFGSAVCMFGYGLSKSIAGIYFFRCLHGLTHGTIAALSMIMASQDADSDMITTAIATFTLSSTLPSAVGPALGLKLAEKVGYSTTYCIAGALMVLGTTIAFRLTDRIEERKPFTLRLDSIFSAPALVPMFMLMLLGLGTSVTSAFFAIRVKANGIEGLGAYYTASAIAMIILRPLAGRVADKIGSEKLIFTGFILLAADLYFKGHCSNEIMLIMSGILYSMGYSCCYSLIQAIAIRLTPKDKRGAASSTCYIGMDGGSLIGGFIWGAVAEQTGYDTPFILAMIPELLAAVLLVTWSMMRRKKESV